MRSPSRTGRRQPPAITRLQAAACVEGHRAPIRRRWVTSLVVGCFALVVCAGMYAWRMYEITHPLGVTLWATPPPSNLVPQDPGSWI